MVIYGSSRAICLAREGDSWPCWYFINREGHSGFAASSRWPILPSRPTFTLRSQHHDRHFRRTVAGDMENLVSRIEDDDPDFLELHS